MALRWPDRSRAIDGAKNAAWDAMYLSKLIEMVNLAAGGATRYIHASLDRKARLITHLVLDFGGDGPHPELKAPPLSEWWPPADAALISGKLAEAFSDLDSPAMQAKRQRASLAKMDTIARGEARLREWVG